MQLRGSSRNAWWQPTLASLDIMQLEDTKGDLEDARSSCIEQCDWQCQDMLPNRTCRSHMCPLSAPSHSSSVGVGGVRDCTGMSVVDVSLYVQAQEQLPQENLSQ